MNSFLAAVFLAASARVLAQDLVAENLRCEYRVNPVGMDVIRPRLSWTLASGQRGQKQTAYQILVAASRESLAQNRGDLWDTGKADSD